MSPSFFRGRNGKRRIALLITFAAYAWRIQGLSGQSLWRDEIDAIYFALRDLSTTLSMFITGAQNGPLYFLALRPWLRLMGTSEFALRYPPVLFSTLSVSLLWQVARQLMPANGPAPAKATAAGLCRTVGTWLGTVARMIMNDPALLAALLLAVNPYQLWYARDGKMYALVTLMPLLAIWFWLQAVRHGGWRPWLGLLIAVSLAMYSHLLLILLIPMFTVWFLLAWPRGKRRLLGFVVTLAALTLPYLPMVWWQWDFLTSPDQLTAIPFTPLDTLLESVLLTQTYGVLTPTALYLLAPIVTLLAYGLLVGLKFDAGRRGGATLLLEAWRYHLLIVSWLVIPVLLIYLLSLRQPVFLPRYIIWIAPAVMILIAWGAHFIWHNGRSAGRVFATVLVVYALTLWTYLGWLQKSTEVKTDLRSAVRYVLQYRDPKDLLILQVPHLEIAYRYYSSDQGRFPFRGSDDRLGWWQGGLWTNNGLGDDEFRRLVDLAMQDITGGATGIWVMRSEAETWDARNLMGEWLDQNMMLVEEVEYHLADVRFYRR